jgi:outer membrane lipoprotein SlyB
LDRSTERRYRALAVDRAAALLSKDAAMIASSASARRVAALGLAASLVLGAVLPARAQDTESYAAGTAAAAVTYGSVRSIDRAGSSAERPHGAGAVVGGILGAVIGRQFADGTAGRNVGTAIGAAAGAFIGNEIEKSVRRDRATVRIAVTLDDGSVRHFDFKEPGDLRVGDRVRVEGNMLYRVS